MQAIPGGIKTLVILISNKIPDKSTDQNTTQPPYRLTFFLFIKLYYIQIKYQLHLYRTMSSLIGSQNTHTVLNCTFERSHMLLIQNFCMSLLKGSQFNQNKKKKTKNKRWGLIFLPHFIYMSKKGPPSGAHNSTQNTICFMHKGEHATGE